MNADREQQPGRLPFEPPYTSDDLPQLDSLHNLIGLGPEWLASDRRAEIAAERPVDAGTPTDAPAPSQAATEAHSDAERHWKVSDAALRDATERLEAAEAKVARVEALLGRQHSAWDGATWIRADGIRAALAGPAPRTRIHDSGCVDCDNGVTEFHRSRTDKPNPLRTRDDQKGLPDGI